MLWCSNKTYRQTGAPSSVALKSRSDWRARNCSSTKCPSSSRSVLQSMRRAISAESAVRNSSAEISTRDLSKKLDSFQRDMDFADRPLLDKVKARLQQVHDELLLGLMEGKRK